MAHHEIAPPPIGDIILTLRNPDAPFFPLEVLEPDSDRSSISSSDESPDEEQQLPPSPKPEESLPAVTFRLSSAHLMLASPVFTAALTGGFRESKTANGEYQIEASDWDARAFFILIAIIHGHHPWLPESHSVFARG